MPSCRGTQRRPRRSQSPSAWTVARWTCWCRSCTRARQTPTCPSSPGRSALITSLRRTAGPRRPRSCSSRPLWITCSIHGERDSRGSSSGTWPASTPARPPWQPCGPHSLTSCLRSSRHKARRTYSPATWPSSAASRAASRRRRAPRLPAPSSMAPSTAWP